MENLIDDSYFVDELRLANVTTNADAKSALVRSIGRKQLEFLTELLGPELYPQFETWYGVDPLDNSDPFFYLLNGQTFVKDDVTYSWVGLRNTTLKISPIANYVYFHYQRNNVTQTTAPGEAKMNSQNAQPAGPFDKQKWAWDQMAKWLYGYVYFMEAFYSMDSIAVIGGQLLPYRSPFQIKAGVTAGVTAGLNTFTFDGTGGVEDWRGYDVYPERIGQGTLPNANYTWDKNTGVFTLDLPGDVFQPNEIFNFTFGLAGISFSFVSSVNYWNNYKNRFYNKGLLRPITYF